jgi:hypothetical protein
MSSKGSKMESIWVDSGTVLCTLYEVMQSKTAPKTQHQMK